MTTKHGLIHFKDTAALQKLKDAWLKKEQSTVFVRLDDGSYYELSAKGYAPLGPCATFEEKAEKLKATGSNGLYLLHFSKPKHGFDPELLSKRWNELHDCLVTNKESGMRIVAQYIYWPESYHKYYTDDIGMYTSGM